MNKELRSALILLLAAAIWGAAMSAQREGAQYLGPFSFNAARFTLGALVMLPLMLRESRKTGAPITLRSVWPGALLGAVLFLASLLQQASVGQSGAGKAGFLTALYVVLVPVIGALFGKKTHWITWLSMLAALPALYLLCVPAGEGFSLAPSDHWLLLSAGIWAAQILLMDHFVADHSPLQLCAAQFFSAAVLNWAFAAVLEGISPAQMLRAAVPLLYCGVFSTGVGYLLQAIGQKGCRPAYAALIMSLESVFCVLFGALLLGETMDGRGYAGCALMLLAVLVAQAGAMIGGSKEENHV